MNRISYDNNNNLADFSRWQPLNCRTIHNQAVSIGENFVTSADPTYIPSSQSPESRSVKRLTESRPFLSRTANIQSSHQNSAAQATQSRSWTTFDQSNSQGKRALQSSRTSVTRNFQALPISRWIIWYVISKFVLHKKCWNLQKCHCFSLMHLRVNFS